MPADVGSAQAKTLPSTPFAATRLRRTHRLGESLEDLRDQARELIIAAPEGSATKHVLPWLWSSQTSGGQPLTSAGEQLGAELRLSRYAKTQSPRLTAWCWRSTSILAPGPTTGMWKLWVRTPVKKLRRHLRSPLSEAPTDCGSVRRPVERLVNHSVVAGVERPSRWPRRRWTGRVRLSPGSRS